MFKVNNKAMKVTSSGVFIINFETYFTPFSSDSVVNFEQINVCWLISYEENRLVRQIS